MFITSLWLAEQRVSQESDKINDLHAFLETMWPTLSACPLECVETGRFS